MPFFGHYITVSPELDTFRLSIGRRPSIALTSTRMIANTQGREPSNQRSFSPNTLQERATQDHIVVPSRISSNFENMWGNHFVSRYESLQQGKPAYRSGFGALHLLTARWSDEDGQIIGSL
jgi:hypothetical protein